MKYLGSIILTVAAFWMVSGLFIEAAYLRHHVAAIIGVSSIAAIAFHVLLYLLSNSATAKTVKSVDYIVGVLAFIAILGVFEVEETIQSEEAAIKVDHQKSEVVRLAECKTSDRSVYCEAERRLVSVLTKPTFDRGESWEIVQRMKRDLNEKSDPNRRAIVKGTIEILSDEFRSDFEKRYGFILGRYIGKIWIFYMVGVAVALRLAKTSAEIFEWYKKGPLVKNA